MRHICFLAVVWAALASDKPGSRLYADDAAAAHGRERLVEGEVEYQPPTEENGTPKPFRLERHRFAYQQRALAGDFGGLEISFVTFPSPVNTPYPPNNTVHCEFFRPDVESKKRDENRKLPGVIVLHILGGDFELSRAFCHALAHRGAAALFVKLPYYGPRRPPESRRRMVSVDPRETVQAMTQAVLDIRRAAAWLAQQESVDGERLGVFGISLGGITAALASTAEPRLKNICILLAGGDVSKVAWESPELAEVRRRWVAQGKTQQDFIDVLRQIDPAHYGTNVKGRRILMLNATQDKIIPRECTISLWKSFGEPPLIWYEGGHYSAGRHIFSVMGKVTGFFSGHKS